MSEPTDTARCANCSAVMRGLLGYLRMRSPGSIVMPNVFVGNSPWESDVTKVTEAGYWCEYEVKVSVSDYRADFKKCLTRWNSESLQKHYGYASDGPMEIRSRGATKLIPKPKQFYFVVPAGLLEGIEVPSYCGILEFTKKDKQVWEWGITVTRRAPNLKPPTKLSPKDIFMLAMKASHRLGLPSA